MNDNETEWRAGLKRGDEVVTQFGFGRGSLRTGKVERATAARVTVSGLQYNRSNGIRVSSARMMTTGTGGKLLQPTPERLNTIRRDILAARFANEVKWANLPLATLEAVAALVWPAPEPATQDEG